MTKLDPKLYVGREQTYAKHFVLANYLERLTYIAGPAYGTISYIMQSFCRWPNKRRALWTIAHAGWQGIGSGRYMPRQGGVQ